MTFPIPQPSTLDLEALLALLRRGLPFLDFLPAGPVGVVLHEGKRHAANHLCSSNWFDHTGEAIRVHFDEVLQQSSLYCKECLPKLKFTGMDMVRWGQNFQTVFDAIETAKKPVESLEEALGLRTLEAQVRAFGVYSQMQTWASEAGDLVAAALRPENLGEAFMVELQSALFEAALPTPSNLEGEHFSGGAQAFEEWRESYQEKLASSSSWRVAEIAFPRSGISVKEARLITLFSHAHVVATGKRSATEQKVVAFFPEVMMPWVNRYPLSSVLSITEPSPAELETFRVLYKPGGDEAYSDASVAWSAARSV